MTKRVLGNDPHFIVNSVVTLVRQIFRQPKKYPLLIQQSRPSRDSQEPKTKIIFQLSRGLFQKIPFLYFFLHKSWIWRTLGRVIKKVSYCHFYNASKENFWPKKILNFMHGFKSAILAIFHFCQKALLNPCMKFKIFLAKSFLLKHHKNGNKNFFFVTRPRVRQIQDLCRKKYKKGIF